MMCAKDELIEAGIGSYLRIVVCLCLVCGTPCAMMLTCNGIFYGPMANDLGVSTAEVSAWMSCLLISCAIFSPIGGTLCARYDMRVLMVVSTLGMAIAFVAFAQASAPWMLWAVGAFAGIPNAMLTVLASSVLINRWFVRHAGALIGTATAFTGAGGVVFAIVGQAIIDMSGWRVAYLAYAAITVCVCIPAILLLVRSYPSEVGLLPYGTGRAERSDQSPAADAPTVDVRVGMRSAAFWAVFAAGFLINFTNQIVGFFPKYVDWVNAQAALGLAVPAFVTGAVLVSASQAGNAIGKIVMGLCADLSVRTATLAVCASCASGALMLLLLPGTPLLPIGGFMFGTLSAGVLVLMPMFTRCVFGEGKNYPVFYGRLAVAVTVGGALANVVWPVVADAFGFNVVFVCALVCLAIVCVLGLIAYGMRNSLPRI